MTHRPSIRPLTPEQRARLEQLQQRPTPPALAPLASDAQAPPPAAVAATPPAPLPVRVTPQTHGDMLSTIDLNAWDYPVDRVVHRFMPPAEGDRHGR